MKKRYRVTIDLVFEPEDKEDLELINEVDIVDAIDEGLGSDAAYNFFGEELSMAGLLTPSVKSIKEIK